MRIPTPTRNRVRSVAREVARDGRRRADALIEAIPASTMEDARHAVEDLREQVEPLVDRALRRRRSRRSPLRFALALAVAAGLAALAYFLWKRDGEQPAYLIEEPERPDITPAAPLTPSGNAPAAPTGDAPSGDSPVAPTPVTETYREAVGARGWTPASNTTAERAQPEARAGRPLGVSLPGSPSTGAPFAAARDLLPGRGDLGLPRFPR